MYQLLRQFFFLLPAETAHYLAMNILKACCSIPLLRKAIGSQFAVKRTDLQKKCFGLWFPNPVGLGAGFDKNARYLRELQVLGFGFVEIGTVTPRPQAGNPKPRLFRLVKDKALINRMGFNNDGVELVTERLQQWRANATGPLIIGGNIGKNKDTPNEEAWKDYETCFLKLHPYVDFFVVNVSSPNTPGLRALQEKEALGKILRHLQQLNLGFKQQRPILLKIAPDLEPEALSDVLELADEINLDGLVASNTTISRAGLKTSNEELAQIGAGGLSGQPLREKATGIIQNIIVQSDGRLPVIGSGGIFNASDAREKLDSGAVLVEVWTGFIYEGPSIVKKICLGL